MNNLSARRRLRPFAACLATLMLALGVVVPVLERADLGHHEQWESEHAPGACSLAHDHRICTHAGAHLSVPANAIAYHPTLRVVPGDRHRARGLVFRLPQRVGHPTRAPPSV